MHTAGVPGRTTEQPERGSSPSSRLTREQVVDRIIAINPSAKADFLGSFDEPALSHYLEHLVATRAPRGRNATWLRQHETPAILTREPRA